MSKKLSKVMIAILAAVMAFCFCIAMASTTTAKADVADCKIEMVDKVQVRQTGEMGIRFNATISAADYDALTAAGAEFGMILAPADWLTSDAELSFYSTTLVEYDGTQGATDKFFAKGTNVPVQDVTDIDGDNDITEYVLTCSFIKIKDTNFDRDFVARAYFKVGADYYESETVVERNIYTVASKALIGGDVEDDVVTDYLADIVGKVATEDSTLNVVVNGDVANKGDKFTVTATLTTAKNKVVETGVALSVERGGDIVVDGLSFDATTGEYTVNTAGKLTLVAKAGGKTVDVKELTAKRSDVSVTLVPGVAGETWKDFVALADASKVLYSDFTNNKVDLMGNSVILKATIEDPENPDATVGYNDFTLTGNPTYYQLNNYSGQIYLANLDRTKKIEPVTGVSVTYTDTYGLEYTASLPVYGSYSDVTIANFGKDDVKWTATDSLLVESKNMSSGYTHWTTIEDVPLTSLSTESLIEFTVLKDDVANNGQYTSKTLTFIVSEAGNPSNWIKVAMCTYSNGYVAIGMNTPNWPTTKLGYAMRGTSFNTLISTADDSNPGWYNSDNYFATRALFGSHQWAHDAENYRGEMIAFSVLDSEVFISAGWKKDASWTWTNVSSALLPKVNQTETNGLSEFNAFDGFNALGKKVDISFAASNFRLDNGLLFVIDKLGGEKVTADWLDNMYYSYTTTGMPYLESDATNA